MVRNLDPEKRKLYLETGLKLFAQKGVQNTSTAAISREAGTAAGTLFLYFPTKQALINELAIEISREQADSINEVIDENFSAYESFLTIWETTLDWFRKNPDAYKYILQVRDSEWLEASVAEETGRMFIFYYAAIQKGLEEGSIADHPIELIGNLLYHNIVGVMNLILKQTDPAVQQIYTQKGFEIFWNGIKK